MNSKNNTNNSYEWISQIEKSLINKIDVTIGDNRTVVTNLDNNKFIQIDYYKNKCTYVEILDKNVNKSLHS